MPQYAVLIFERAYRTPGGVADLPAEVLAANGELDGKIAERGGRVLGGLALEDAGTATSIRGDLVTDGPFIETKETLAGVYVLEARDLDHALALAKMTPVGDGGVEVRPLIGWEASG